MKKQPSERFFRKDIMRNFAKFTKKASVPESFFIVFSNEFFSKFARTSFLQNCTGPLLLIIAVSVVAKGVQANKTENYLAKTKAYVLI